MRSRLAVGALFLASTALVACGDGETTTVTETTTATQTTTVTTEQTTGGETTTTGETDFQPEPCPGAESPPNITNVTSYGTSCEAVEAAMAELRGVSRSFRIGDFDCTRVSGARLGGTWECRGEASYFTFDFGD